MKSIIYFILSTIALSFATTNEFKFEYSQFDEAQRKTALIGGDLMIGALFPIHESPSYTGQKNPLKCGAVREQYGIQRVEAALRTVDQINKSPSILPNITLGIEIRDTCWNPLIALHQSLQFVQKLFVTQDWYSCRQNSPKNICESNAPPILGVIGPASSDEAIQVQNLLQLFHIPQVGYSTTTTALNDKEKFEYFVRVVPSDYHQASVMIQILQKFGWNYVFAVNSEGEYGRSGIKIFLSLAKDNNICIATEFAVKEHANSTEFDEMMNKFGQYRKAKVVICFCDGDDVRKILEATKRMNKVHSFVFIGSDGWAGRDDVVKDLEDAAQGSILISLRSRYVSDLDSFYFDLNKNVPNNRNPWLDEFRSQRFNCSAKEPLSRCTGNESSEENNHVQDPKLSYIVKSIYALAHALHRYRNHVCGKNAPVCTDLYPINGTMFMEYLRTISFNYHEEVVEFDEKGNPSARYDILNYKRMKNGSYGYQKVGTWDDETFILNIKDIQLPGELSDIRSVCAESCLPGHRKLIDQNVRDNRTCCWSCPECEVGEISDGETCQSCKKGDKPDSDKKACIPMLREYTHYTDLIGIICITYASVGILLTLATAFVFYKFGNTPVVKYSTKELCYMMFSGMVLSHLCTFIIIGRPTKLTCSLIRILPSVGTSIIFSALLVKTNRISRILSMSKKRFPTLKPKMISTTFQIYMSSILICIEVLICIISLYVNPAEVDTIIVGSHGNEGAKNRAILECYSVNTNKWQDLLIQSAFNVLLLSCCTLYAVKTRRLPNNFNEARFIGFACYATAITWLAFISIYLGSSSLQILSRCISISTYALINLVLLFFPKLYIILLKPEKNTRANFTTTKNLRCHFGSTFMINNCEQLLSGMVKNSFSSNTTVRFDIDQIRKQLQDYQLNGLSKENKTISCQTSFTELYRTIPDPSCINEETDSDPEVTT